MKKAVFFFLALAVSGAGACMSENATDPAREPSADASTSSNQDAAPAAHTAPAALKRCAVGRQEPLSIHDAITKINALLPVDAPCFIAALPRPLSVIGSLGTTSAQPADPPDSPRLLFLTPFLIVTAVPSGAGSQVLEFGEWVSATQTLKGEIPVPVTSMLASDAAFTRVQMGTTGTRCGTCHTGERAGTTPNSYYSDAFRPHPDLVVTVKDLSAMHDLCVKNNDPSDRCMMLHAVFDLGTVVDGQFDDNLGVFP